jgi:putative holliday junction resolvase
MNKILAIDFGTKRIGLAISDGESTIAHKYDTILNTGERTIKNIADVCLKEDVDCVLVGLPIGLSGRDTKMTEQARDFASKLEKSGLRVSLFDERFTSKSALQAVLKEEKDVESARIFLQTYLDKKANEKS